MIKLEDAQIVTAMVTPLSQKDCLDKARLKALIEYLLVNGTQGLLINGTTGESPTLTAAEAVTLVEQTAELVGGRVPIIVGAGTNSTKTTVENIQKLTQVPEIAAVLVVVPYYNKPDQAGMFAHFTRAADESRVPVIIYNIPGRTGVTMEVQTVLKLAQHPNIVGVKNCTGAADLAELIENAPSGFLVYSGEDEDALAVKTLGGAGIISVASHLYGKQLEQMYQLVDQGKILPAGQLMRKLTPKIKALFNWPSPAPVKASLNEQGVLVGQPRLPILPLNQQQQEELMTILSKK